VAIDGPAGSGKSTLGRRLAEAVRLPYVNTGLMYRAVADRALKREIDPDDGPALAEIGGEMTFTLSPDAIPSLLIDGEPPGPALESAAVEGVVSRVARHPQVRTVLRAIQRRLGAGGCVMEGRDIGTVVFPDADVKIFLSATPSVRAGRRGRERGGAEEAVASVTERDALDARTNPFVPAPDAHVLDTTVLSSDAVFVRALDLVRTITEGNRR